MLALTKLLFNRGVRLVVGTSACSRRFARRWRAVRRALDHHLSTTPFGEAMTSKSGTAPWAAALALISAPARLPGWLRLMGGAAACLFAITAGRIYAGEVLLPTSSPLPFFAYPFLVATLVGWAWMLLREPA
ncbi:MAG: hypothetical protein L0Z62_22405 [Gemmataceae bacterium]|nr:hypothetical protein [Gemmataceae bacterium]